MTNDCLSIIHQYSSNNCVYLEDDYLTVWLRGVLGLTLQRS